MNSEPIYLVNELTFPNVILFDWHGTLVDTLDAMYLTMEEMLPQLESLDLVGRLIAEEQCRTQDDAKLVRYIRIFRRLHPKILAERRVSRTEIFNAIFGQDIEAKRTAHHAYNRCYRSHYGEVKPFQDGVFEYLSCLKKLGLRIGVATNRSREFLDQEIQLVDDGRWQSLFDVTVCADDVKEYKPDPDVIHQAVARLGVPCDERVWYVGDSHTDMVTAFNAGVTRIFYNGAHWEERWIDRIIAEKEKNPEAPAAVVDSFEELIDVLMALDQREPGRFQCAVDACRPRAFPRRAPPPPRVEPDWHPAVATLTPPELILFDWHATLVDTLDAMYHAVDDMLPQLESLGLMNRLIKPEQSKSPEDAKLVEHVKNYRQLHPKIKADRKISRTDIFEVLFGEDQEAKQIAHKAFNHHYRNHFGTVLPFEPQVRAMLEGIRRLGLHVGVITNRDREFFEHELAAVEDTGWAHLFDTAVCGDDTLKRKPHPDQLLLAIERVGYADTPAVWYVGDSTTDTIASKATNITSVFFNGAQWDLPWLQKIFPGTSRFPHKPDVVVNDFSEFWALVLACVNRTQ
ncbi:HAD family hydrolase [Oleiphilus messinensis]|uniref:HAD family hydrolase n=1 Tax=Oleiphilus messinensis TaxID=141451 RepID=A0A1Y0ICE3_9GAMM|nr:HAD-IA family hydrolase [Oleiphilus messinensis]ARU58232.1 HAD family hydrolase [Oleiphilus messinensis]